MSILSSPIIGTMQTTGFFAATESNKQIWISDSFSVEHSLDENKKLLIDVTFKTPGDNEVLFKWDLTSLKHLSKPMVLSDTLFDFGVRVATSPYATVILISAFQNIDSILYLNNANEVH